MNPAIETHSGKVFLHCSSALVLIFLFTRLPFYLYYPVINLTSDSASYLAVAIEIYNCNFPYLDLRTPGYPLLLAFAWLFSKNFILIVIIQSLLTLASSLFLLWSLNKVYNTLTVYFTLAITAFISSPYFVILENTILTESFFVSILFVNCSFLILLLKSKRSMFAALYSLTAGILVLIRPDAFFLLPVFLILMIYFFVSKMKPAFYISLIIPVAMTILLLSLYNFLTLNKFTVAPVGELNLSALTIMFMEESPQYPERVNKAIKSTLEQVPSKDIAYFKNSSGFSKFIRIYNDNGYRSWNLVENLLKEHPGSSYLELQPVLGQISRDAVMKYPAVYAKIIFINLYQFFKNFILKWIYSDELMKIYEKIYVTKKYISELEDDTWRPFYADGKLKSEVKSFYLDRLKDQRNKVLIDGNPDQAPVFGSTLLLRSQVLFEKIYNVLFKNVIWLILFAVVFMLSVYNIVITRFREICVIIPLAFCLIYLSKALLISLTAVSIARYSYTVEFAIFLSLPFLIYFMKNPNKSISKKYDTIFTSVR